MAKGELVKKIAAVALELGAVGKDGTHQQGWKYVSAEAFIEAVRGPMLSKGIIIIPQIECEWVAQQSSNGKPGTAARTIATYFVTDGEEEIKLVVPGEGWDHGDKAVYKALTGGYKYLLRMLFCLPMEDDPEKDTRPQTQPQGQTQQRPPPQSQSPRTVTNPPPSGGAENAVKHEGDGFGMDECPRYKKGNHVFAKGPNVCWDEWTWRQMADAHLRCLQETGETSKSPLQALLDNEFVKGWLREHGAYLDQTIRNAVPSTTEPQSLDCPTCGEPGDGELCPKCLDEIPF